MHKASDLAVCRLHLDTHLFSLTNGIECGTATDANTLCTLCCNCQNSDYLPDRCLQIGTPE